jgi:hypothetical protein
VVRIHPAVPAKTLKRFNYLRKDKRHKVSVHSAPRSGRGGRRFKSCHSDQHLAKLPVPSGTTSGTDTLRFWTVQHVSGPASAATCPPARWWTGFE